MEKEKLIMIACNNRRKAIQEELVAGRDFADQLRRLVINGESQSHDASSSAEHLLGKVLMSFTNTLLLFNNNPSLQPAGDASSSRCGAKSDEDSQSQDSNCKTTPTVKNRRGCYKRRRTSQTWEKVSETPIEDGHQWRKYGQKGILNAKYPRNYYRCTHKYDQGCQAIKQVQRVQEKPALYKTTYYGHHTCDKNLLNHEMIHDSSSPCDSNSILISFDNNTLPATHEAKQDACPIFSSPLNSKKEFNKAKNNPSSNSSNNNCMPSSEVTFDNSISRHVPLSSTLDESDHRDVISGALCDFDELGDFIFYSSALLNYDYYYYYY